MKLEVDKASGQFNIVLKKSVVKNEAEKMGWTLNNFLNFAAAEGTIAPQDASDPNEKDKTHSLHGNKESWYRGKIKTTNLKIGEIRLENKFSKGAQGANLVTLSLEIAQFVAKKYPSEVKELSKAISKQTDESNSIMNKINILVKREGFFPKEVAENRLLQAEIANRAFNENHTINPYNFREQGKSLNDLLNLYANLIDKNIIDINVSEQKLDVISNPANSKISNAEARGIKPVLLIPPNMRRYNKNRISGLMKNIDFNSIQNNLNRTQLKKT